MKPNDLRAKRLITFLWIFTAIVVLSAISDFMQYSLLSRMTTGDFTLAEAESNDQRQMLVNAIVLIVQIGVYIVFIQWFRRAYYNMHRISSHLSFSEGWAAGAWFVPFLNLGRPFVIMKEMMYEAESKLIGAGMAGEDPSRKSAVGIWWTLWISVNVISNINFRIQIKSESLPALINTTLADIVISLLFVPLTFFTVRMIRKYNELEDKLPDLENHTREIRIDNSEILDSI